MKKYTAANLAMLLVFLAYLALFLGVTMLNGDARPGTSDREVLAVHNLAMSLEVSGYLFVLCAVWLSGYSFVAAKKRSLLAVFGCLIVLAIQIYFD